MLSSPKDASRLRGTLLLPRALVTPMLGGWGNIVFYSGGLTPGSTMGASIIKGEGGMGTFEDNHQCLPHSLCSIPLPTPIFT